MNKEIVRYVLYCLGIFSANPNSSSAHISLSLVFYGKKKNVTDPADKQTADRNRYLQQRRQKDVLQKMCLPYINLSVSILPNFSYFSYSNSSCGAFFSGKKQQLVVCGQLISGDQNIFAACEFESIVADRRD